MLKTYINQSKSAVSNLMFRAKVAQYASKLPTLQPDECQIIDTLNTRPLAKVFRGTIRGCAIFD